MGFGGALLAGISGLGTGFAQAARQRQQEKWQTEQQQYHDTLNFYESIAKDPRLSPAYLPQVVSGIAQLHGLKPGKKDHDQLVQTVKGLSDLLQGGQGAPTEDTSRSGLVQNPNPTGPPPSQPTQGGMVSPQAGQFNQQPNQVQLPPMPQIGGMSIPGGIQDTNGSEDTRPRLVANGQPQSDNGQLNPIALPPAPQLLTQGQITTKKALPAFQNQYALKLPYEQQKAAYTEALKEQGMGVKSGYTMTEIGKKTEGWLERANLNNDAKDEHALKSQMATDRAINPKLQGETDEQYDDRIAAISGKNVNDRQNAAKEAQQAHTQMVQKQIADFDGRVADRKLALNTRIAQLQEMQKQHAFSNDMRARYGQAVALKDYWATLENSRSEKVQQLNKLDPTNENNVEERNRLTNEIGNIHSKLTELATTVQKNFEGPYGENNPNAPTGNGKKQLVPKGGGGAQSRVGKAFTGPDGKKYIADEIDAQGNITKYHPQ